MKFELGFLGAGNMAEAIAKAAISKGLLQPDQMVAADPVDERKRVFAALGIAIADNPAIVAGCRYVLLAVKPQTLPQLQAELATLDAPRQVLVSIMAGVGIARLEAMLGRPGRVIRVMPNLPLQIGDGMSAIAVGPHAQPGDDDFVVRLFSSAGRTIVVAEALLDAVTGVSGSGPGYIFYMAEAMERAAEELGLGQHARLLVRQTLLGAAHLLERSGLSPGDLRRKVTSPGGTTHAAISVLDSKAVAQAMVDAVKAATRRSRELGSGVPPGL
jgi:pyrroline-5-carboxylate reductase